MPSLTPPETWVGGPATSAMMNARVRDKLRELQRALPMGPIASWIAPLDTVTTTGAGGAGKPVDGWDGKTLTITTARWLAVTLYNTNLWGSAIGVRPNLAITINGDVSLVVGQPVSLAGGAGILRLPATGRLLSCPAGTVTIGALLKTDAGATGNSTLGGTAQLQVVDYGAA